MPGLFGAVFGMPLLTLAGGGIVKAGAVPFVRDVFRTGVVLVFADVPALLVFRVGELKFGELVAPLVFLFGVAPVGVVFEPLDALRTGELLLVCDVLDFLGVVLLTELLLGLRAARYKHITLESISLT